jgi:hypothetical protein
MPAHSDLIDAEDLHYAKAKLFTGSPTEVVPDFAGQILVDNLKRMWVAGSKSIGDLIQIGGNAIGGDDGGGGAISPSAAFGEGSPSTIPDKVGLQYVNLLTHDIYASVHTRSINGWIVLGKMPLKVTASFANSSTLDIADIVAVRLYYVDLDEPNAQIPVEGQPYEFTNFIWEVTGEEAFLAPQGLNLTLPFNRHGGGAYVFTCELAGSIEANLYYLATTFPVTNFSDADAAGFYNTITGFNFTFGNSKEVKNFPDRIVAAQLSEIRDAVAPFGMDLHNVGN